MTMPKVVLFHILVQMKLQERKFKLTTLICSLVIPLTGITIFHGFKFGVYCKLLVFQGIPFSSHNIIKIGVSIYRYCKGCIIIMVG